MTKRIREQHPNKIIRRVLDRQQRAKDTAQLVAAGKPLPTAPHGHSSHHRQIAIAAHCRRLELLIETDFLRLQGQQVADKFLAELLADLEPTSPKAVPQ
jgi:hypothetical protein